MKKTVFTLCFLVIIILNAGSQTLDTLWNRGINSFSQKNYHGLCAYMDSVLVLNSMVGEAYYNRALAKINLGNIEDACADLQLAQQYETKISKDFIDYQCDPEFVRKIMIKEFYKNEKVYPQTGYRPQYTRADTLRGALRPERTCFDVTFYNLSVSIFPDNKKIKAGNDIYFKVVEPTKTIQIDLFDDFKIAAITWNNISLKWRREFNALFIDFPRTLNPGERHSIKVIYRGKPMSAPNPPWDGGFVWKKDKNHNLWLGVACEQLGASSWWPNKDHLSDKPDSMQISIEIPAGYQAVCNGNPRKIEKVNDNRNRFTWFIHYPINNYNATFYVGKYVAFSDTLIEGKDTLRMDYNVLNYNLDTAKMHFKQTRDVLSFYNKAFGFYPYPKDGFGLVESPYEGMEHQTAIAYGHGYKKNNDDYRNKMYDYIIVHEAAHEWWGNSVTARDMADIWIHEGFATYAEYMFLENRFGKDDYYYELTDKSRYIFNVWPMVQHRDVNEDAFASNDVYNKGAMMLHCLRCIINNDSVFFGLVHDFCVSHKYKTVTTGDFIAYANNYAHMDNTSFLKKFLYDTKIPVLEYRFEQDGHDLVLTYRWAEVENGFSMPFGIQTDTKMALRIEAGTTWKEMRIPETAWFNFFNIWNGYEGCADNSYTYYHTRIVKTADL
jgi:aminopeptidase N